MCALINHGQRSFFVAIVTERSILSVYGVNENVILSFEQTRTALTR